MKQNCSQCGICCRLFQITLNEEEYKSGRYRTQLEKFKFTGDFSEATACGATIIKQKTNGACFYLKANKCSIHEIRPQVCRPFFCSSKAKRFEAMITKIKDYKSAIRPVDSLLAHGIFWFS